jgi:hypothetical protein
MHSTNYYDTLICPAEDCQTIAKIPDKPASVAALQYQMLAQHPYAVTSDDVLLAVAAQRKGIDQDEIARFREAYFSKGQPCFRASPLTKTHGWAIHANGDGYVSLISPDSAEFARLRQDDAIKKTCAMRNKRK